MTVTKLTLGGVAIEAEKGAPVQSYAPLGDGVIRYRSRGRPVKFRHWTRRMSVSVSGSGILPPGLSGLNYDEPLELRCTKPLSISTASLTTTLTTDVRPDRAPWAFAYVDERWQRSPVSVVGRAVTFTAVAGATAYQVCWMPVLMVFVSPPDESMSDRHEWSFTAEEV